MQHEIIEKERKFIMQTYNRHDLVAVDGEGMILRDIQGNEYLDFVGGIAVNSVGHCHRKVVEAVKKQVETLIHTSNLYYTIPQVELAEKLCKISGMDKVFFCNSGAEANEGAVKLARIYAKKFMENGPYEIITMEGSFHGRTMMMVAATGQKKVKKGFEPLPEGFIHVPYGDTEALKQAVTSKTCAIMLEVIQGEAGVVFPPEGYIQDVASLCRERGLLLIIDEVQTGMGRLGTFLGHERFRVTPDIATLAKGLGGGIAIGAILARDEIAKAFSPGSHASTFGGNPIACAAAKAVVQQIASEEFLNEVRQKGEYFLAKLKKVASKSKGIKEVRGMGLMLAIELEHPAVQFTDELIKRGFLSVPAGENTVRFLPPLIVQKKEIDLLIDAISDILS